MTEKALTGQRRLDAPVLRADERDPRRARPTREDGVALDVALSRLVSPDRDVRRTTAEAVTAALEPGLRTRAYVFNTLLQDKAVDDRLRSYPNWLASRNLANEASDESVQALLEAVRARYELPRRWYRLKAELLGLDRLADYDRMAAVADEEVPVEWPEAREPRAQHLPRVLARARRPRAALLRRALDRRAGAPEQARRRVLRLHDAQRAPLRDAQLHRAAAATCSRSPTSSATACTPRSPCRAGRSSSTRR